MEEYVPVEQLQRQYEQAKFQNQQFGNQQRDTSPNNLVSQPRQNLGNQINMHPQMREGLQAQMYLDQSNMKFQNNQQVYQGRIIGHAQSHQPQQMNQEYQQFNQNRYLQQNEPEHLNNLHFIPKFENQVLPNKKDQSPQPQYTIIQNNAGQFGQIQLSNKGKRDSNQLLEQNLVNNYSKYFARRTRNNFDQSIGEENMMSSMISLNESVVIKNSKEANDYFKHRENDMDDVIEIQVPKVPMPKNIQVQDTMKKPFKLHHSEPPNIHLCKELTDLGKQYKSEFYQYVVKDLKDLGFTHFRGVRGDGNCYYRSVACQFMEIIILERNIEALENLIKWVASNHGLFKLDNKTYQDYLLQGWMELLMAIQTKYDSDQYLFNLLQRLFILNSGFDKGMIFLIRSMAKNFLQAYSHRSFNGLPFTAAIAADANNLDEYIQDILMKMETDAQGPLLYIMPIVLRINVYIVNVDTSAAARVNMKKKKISIEECKASFPDIQLKANDGLDQHNKYLFVLRKEGHYDAIYHKDQEQYRYLAEFNRKDPEVEHEFEQFNRVWQNQFNGYQQAKDTKQDRIPEIQEDSMTLACCGNKINKTILKMSFQPENNDRFLEIDGKVQIPSCPVCGHRMHYSDLYNCFSDHSEREILDRIFNTKSDQQQTDQQHMNQPMKSQVPQEIQSPQKKQTSQKLEKPIDQESICSLCKEDILEGGKCIWPKCNCLFHKDCIIKELKGKIENIKNLLQQSQKQKIDYPVCINKNCLEFPKFKLEQDDYQKLLEQLGIQGVIYEIPEKEDIFLKLNKCEHKISKLDFLHHYCKDQIPIAIINQEGKIEKLYNLFQNDKELKSEVLSLKCCIENCQYIIDKNELCSIFNFSNTTLKFLENIQKEIIANKLNCFHCAAAFLAFENDLEIVPFSWLYENMLNYVILNHELDPFRQKKIEKYQLEQFKLDCLHNRPFLHNDYEFYIKKIKKKMAHLIQSISGSGFQTNNISMECQHLSSQNSQHQKNFHLCPLCKSKIYIDCLEKKKCPNCNLDFKKVKRFCIKCKVSQSVNLIAYFQQCSSIYSICLHCFKKEIENDAYEFVIRCSNCEKFASSYKIKYWCEEKHWSNIDQIKSIKGTITSSQKEKGAESKIDSNILNILNNIGINYCQQHSGICNIGINLENNSQQICLMCFELEEQEHISKVTIQNQAQIVITGEQKLRDYLQKSIQSTNFADSKYYILPFQNRLYEVTASQCQQIKTSHNEIYQYFYKTYLMQLNNKKVNKLCCSCLKLLKDDQINRCKYGCEACFNQLCLQNDKNGSLVCQICNQMKEKLEVSYKQSQAIYELDYYGQVKMLFDILKEQNQLHTMLKVSFQENERRVDWRAFQILSFEKDHVSFGDLRDSCSEKQEESKFFIENNEKEDIKSIIDQLEMETEAYPEFLLSKITYCPQYPTNLAQVEHNCPHRKSKCSFELFRQQNVQSQQCKPCKDAVGKSGTLEVSKKHIEWESFLSQSNGVYIVKLNFVQLVGFEKNTEFYDLDQLFFAISINKNNRSSIFKRFISKIYAVIQKGSLMNNRKTIQLRCNLCQKVEFMIEDKEESNGCYSVCNSCQNEHLKPESKLKYCNCKYAQNKVNELSFINGFGLIQDSIINLVLKFGYAVIKERIDYEKSFMFNEKKDFNSQQKALKIFEFDSIQKYHACNDEQEQIKICQEKLVEYYVKVLDFLSKDFNSGNPSYLKKDTKQLGTIPMSKFETTLNTIEENKEEGKNSEMQMASQPLASTSERMDHHYTQNISKQIGRFHQVKLPRKKEDLEQFLKYYILQRDVKIAEICPDIKGQTSKQLSILLKGSVMEKEFSELVNESFQKGKIFQTHLKDINWQSQINDYCKENLILGFACASCFKDIQLEKASFCSNDCLICLECKRNSRNSCLACKK